MHAKFSVELAGYKLEEVEPAANFDLPNLVVIVSRDTAPWREQ